IVPYTRGKERSRQEEYILNEIREVKALGAREVTLLGQNVNAYGKDLGLEDGFSDLLRKAAETGIERIRFYSSHPRDYRETTIDVMKEYPNIMPALHLPVQSGSNEILKKMNRGYTIERYYELYDRMKEKIPGITFTTDLIVGFPSETTEQFEETLKLVDYCRFDSAFTFVYSPREGTPAARMEDDVSLEEKKKRLAILNERIGTYVRENNEATVGTVLKVLCDGPSRKNANVLAGYSEENRLVNFTGTGIQEGDIVDVRITDAKSFSLDGEAVQ
ncbi:MAG: MiaB/RimO family radical SAM methylthiotransferase, partial [Solobacterium sp.]|nr:MiaB/RimO family radical SAM methylthiotransferase [Solobacterium sp.]